MELSPYIGGIHHQLAATAEAGGDEARALAERLAAPLDAAIRLALQDALGAAAAEITLELAPGSVELRLRGRNPEFVVTAAPVEQPVDDFSGAGSASLGSADTDEGGASRIKLRMPEHPTTRGEEARSSA